MEQRALLHDAPQDGSHLIRAARGGVLNLTGTAVSAVASFALAVAITRGSSKVEAGAFFTATAMFLLATNIGQLGTSSSLVYFLSNARAGRRLHNAPVYLRLALVPVLGLAVVIAAVLAIWAEPAGHLLGNTRSGSNGILGTSVAYLAPFIPFAAALGVYLAGTRGLGTMRASTTVDQIGRSTLQLALVVLALLAGRGDLAPLAWALPYVPLSVLAWLAWRRLCRQAARGQRPEPGYRPTGAFWRFSGARALTSVAQVAMLRLDVVLVASLAGLAQSAVYAAATRFLSLGLLASGAISQAAQPQLGEALALRDRRGAQELYQTATAWLIVPAWPVYLLLLLFSPTIMQLFGPGYEKGSTVVVVLAATMLVASACGMVSMVLTMAGRASWNMYNVLLGVAVQVGLDVWLIPRIGLVGAAIGWASGILVTNLVPLAQLVALHRLHPFGRNSVTAMGLAVAAVGVPAAVARLAFGQTVTALVVAFSAAALLYPAARWATRDRTGLGLLLSAARGRSRRPSPQAG